MKRAILRSRMRCKLLWTCRTVARRDASASVQTVLEISKPAYLGWVDFALDNVENRDIAALARGRRHHDILRL